MKPSPFVLRGAEKNLFERLIQVTIRHSYYNASLSLCPDFIIEPTAASKILMESLGLLFQFDGSGFSVLLNRQASARFLAYLQSQIALASPAGSGAWTRLSFTLATKNSGFVNFTDMPLQVSSASGTFYLSNIEAQTSGGEVQLHSGRLTRSILFPLSGSQYRFVVRDPITRDVIVRDLTGRTVLCQPAYGRNVSPPALQCCPGPSPTDPESSSTARLVSRGPLYFNLARLPEDKYDIVEIESDALDSDSKPAETFVYAYSAPSPLFFVDLLFSRPPDTSSGVYPMDLESGTIANTQYFIDFETRSTTWNYYIVSTGAPLTDLAIVDAGTPSMPPVTFSGPVQVTLANDQTASWFSSTTAIPLQEQSDYNFQLTGQAGGFSVNRSILMQRLPVASSQQIIPGDSNFALAGGSSPPARSKEKYSEIYVYV
jgi:hypothetical protein